MAPRGHDTIQHLRCKSVTDQEPFGNSFGRLVSADTFPDDINSLSCLTAWNCSSSLIDKPVASR